MDSIEKIKSQGKLIENYLNLKEKLTGQDVKI